MTLEEKIKHYRKQAGLSQKKMAEKIGVSRQAITKWENGTGTPDIANLMAIADLFQKPNQKMVLEHPQKPNQKMEP